MAKKCVHKGCGKTYDDDNEECVYHPGPPVFHEGQKGWKCCKPRVLTFDEFLAIPPCTTGTHSDVDDTPAPEPVQAPEIPTDTHVNLGSLSESLPKTDAPPTRMPQAQASQAPAQPAAPVDEDDDPSIPIPADAICRRKGCGAKYSGDESRLEEKCVYHPGWPIFHEGSKGYSCCKRRVLEFEEFLKLEGCKSKDRHLFVGSGKKEGEEKVDAVRHDYYQTATTVVASLFLKKIDKEKSIVEFSDQSIKLDLRTQDSKRYQNDFPLFAPIKPQDCKYRILGTKIEFTLAKADGTTWQVLRSDEKPTGERIQVGQAARV